MHILQWKWKHENESFKQMLLNMQNLISCIQMDVSTLIFKSDLCSTLFKTHVSVLQMAVPYRHV